MQETFRSATAIPYPATYQRELSPAWLHYAATLCGAAVRAPHEVFRYLELGCGRGTSALAHAGSHPRAEFHAVDRDETAIASARRHAQALGLGNVVFHASTFEDVLGWDATSFDFIALHGVYSWVDEAQRAILRDLLRNRLAAGGVAYVSYNSMPGWAAELPLRRLFQELHASRHGNRAADVAWAAGEIEQLRSSRLRYFSAHPTALRAVDSWAGQDPGYLAHEYLADGWEPLWSIDVIDDMESDGLCHIGSATLCENHEELLLEPATSRAIARLATGRLRMLACDLALNRGFRRDLYIRADSRRPDGLPLEGVKRLHVRCRDDPKSIPEAVVVPRGRFHFHTEFIARLGERMGAGVRQIGELARELGGNEQETIRNLVWLVAAGALAPATSPAVTEMKKERE